MCAKRGIEPVGSRPRRRLKPERCRRTAVAFLAFVLAAISGRAETLPDACPAPETRPQIEVLPFEDAEQGTCGFSDDREEYRGCSLSAEYGNGVQDGGEDAVYKVRLNDGNRVGFRLESRSPGTDLVLVLVEECQGAESCESHSPDFITGSTGLEIEEIPPRPYDPGIYYLFVDSATSDPPGRCGPYKLSVFGVNPTPDLDVELTASQDPVVAGKDLTYTLTVANVGTLDATEVEAVLQLPAGTTVRTIPSECKLGAGRKLSCQLDRIERAKSKPLEVVVRVDPAARGVLRASAGAEAQEGEQDLVQCASGGPNHSHCAEVETRVEAETDLAIELSTSPDSVVAGCRLIHTVTVANRGPSEATSVVVTANLPGAAPYAPDFDSPENCDPSPLCPPGSPRSCEPGPDGVLSCPLGTLAPGASVELCVPARVLPSAGAAGRSESLITTVGVARPEVPGTQEELDHFPSNDTRVSRTTVNREADLKLTVTPAPERIVAGTEFRYRVTVVNKGPSNSFGSQVIDTLPPGVSFKSVPKDCKLLGLGQQVECSIPRLTVGGHHELKLGARVSPSAMGSIVHQTEVVSVDDPESKNDGSRIETPVEVESALVLCNSAPREVFRGAPALYRLTVSNSSGPSDWPVNAGNLKVDLPPGWTLKLPPETSCTIIGTELRCPIARLPVGSRQSFRFIASVAPDATGVIATTVGVETLGEPRAVGDRDNSKCFPNLDMNSTTATSTVLDRPDLVLPFFEVDPDPYGATTLLAVQNVTDGSVAVRFDYFAADGRPLAFEETIVPSSNDRITLSPRAIRSVNLRDVSGLPQANASTFGYAWITAIPPTEGPEAPPPATAARSEGPSESTALAGDFFRIESGTEPEGRWAHGSALVAADPRRSPRELCRSWSVRFSNDRTLTQSTDFIFWLTEVAAGVANDEMIPAAAERMVSGHVYDEAGVHKFEVPIVTSENAFSRNSLTLFDEILEAGTVGPTDVPASGTIEWELPEGFHGNVSAVQRGKDFAIGIPGVCRDAAARQHEPGLAAPLVLPYFKVDPETDGATTRFAVRNEGGTEVKVKYRYFEPGGDELPFVESCSLSPGAVRTVDLRELDVAALDSCECLKGGEAVMCVRPGLDSGYVEIQAVPADRDTAPEEPPDPEVPPVPADSVFLSGDFVRLGPDGAQAAGEALIDRDAALAPPQLCERWITRLIHGEGKETDFVFFVPPVENQKDGPVLTGMVRNEAGACLQDDNEECLAEVQLEPGAVAFQVSTADDYLGVQNLAASGSIEWTFPTGRPGNVSTRFRSGDQYSVLVPGICLDQPDKSP